MQYCKKYVELKGPFFHLVTGARLDFYNAAWKWRFYDQLKLVMRFIRGWKIITIDDLFDEFAAALQFPGYFGENWPAFDECMNDLDWLPAQAYLLFIPEVNNMLCDDQHSFRVCMEVLRDTTKEWVEGRTYNPSFPTPPTPFHVVFNCPEDKQESVLKRFKEAGIPSIEPVKLSLSGL
jgi:hypothetical protein